MRKRRSLVLFVVIPLLGSCFAEWRYDGDGQLVDNGMWAATDRYVLDLGALDLTSGGAPRRMRMSHLPETEFFAGIQITPLTDLESLPEDLGSAVVSMRLANTKGDTVMSVSKPLREWRKSSSRVETDAFLYVRDDLSSSFTPMNGNTYWITVSVVPDQSGPARLQARLILKSGGWK